MASVDCKICSKCGIEKNLSLFHKHTSTSDGRRSDCSECVAKYSKLYRKDNEIWIKDKKKVYQQEKPYIKRRSHLKITFNITLEDYNSMLTKQENRCKICKSDHVGNSQHKHLHIDHDHKTGKIRGLLCSKCNTLLGAARDNIKFLEEAIKYLNGVCGL